MDLPSKEHFSSLPLHEQAVQLTRLPAKTRQELILTSRQSLDLARMLSSETFFYTLKEIGLTDAVGLLALASPEQLQDMMDLDCWQKHGLNDRRLLSWLLFLDEAGSSKLAEWALQADVELLVLLVKRHFEVIRNVDVEELLDFDYSLYFTFDDQYLLRFIGDEEPILHLLLERLRVLDYRFYTDILENSLFELETSLEEEALRWRGARLADRGYPDFEEAHDVLRAIQPETVRLEPYQQAAVFRPLPFAADERVIPPDHALLFLSGVESFFGRALSTVSSDMLERIGIDLAYLTNHVVMAEACDTGELSEVRRCAELVHDMLNIGLMYATHGDEMQAQELVQTTKLHPFFQIGWGLTLRLREHAQQLEAFLNREGGGDWQSYFDTPFQETFTGAQRRTPTFFQGLEKPGEVLYRRFQKLADIDQVEAILAHIPHWFMIMRRWGLLPEGPAPQEVTLGVLWNTAFVHWVVGQTVEIQPVHRSDVARFQERVQETSLAEQSAAFLALAATQLDLQAEEQRALASFSAAVQEKLREIIELAVEQADLRFVGGILVAEDSI